MKNIERELKENGVFITKTHGDSMRPMLETVRDRVIIKTPEFPLKKYDIPVYRRDGHYTMHRIVRVRRGKYVIRGDNRFRNEYDICDADIVGVLAAVITGDEIIDISDERYVKYGKKICRNYIFRKAVYIIKHKFLKIRNLPETNS